MSRFVALSRRLSVAAGMVLFPLVSEGTIAQAKSRTRAVMRCGIPCTAAGYQYRLRSTTQMATSTKAILLQTPRPDKPEQKDARGYFVPANRMHLFQLPVAKLELKDRRISRVAFQLNDLGKWTLSLRGDFHDRSEPRTEPFIDGHLRRCKFRVKVRCFGNYPIGEQASNTTTGKPVMLQTQPVEFWVQSGEPYDLWRHGNCCEACYGKQYFDLIDRVEIEFSYYEAAGVTRPVTVLPAGQ